MKELVSIILPAYNEKDNIIPLIDAIREIFAGRTEEYEIIVVDDNSPDGTGRAVEERYGVDKSVRCIVRKDERGLATAIRRGISESSGDIVIVMDTDFNHNPDILPQLIDLQKYYTIVVGSRFISYGGMRDVRRYYLSFLYNLFFIRTLLRTHVQDNLSGLFSIRRAALYDLPWDTIFRGYGDYFLRLLYYAARKRQSVLEVPVYYELRSSGESKTSFLPIFLLYTKATLALKFHALFG
ncbi:MAG TPA: glycosyltransferase [Proteobacteria bacterium]|nr:glycosyltransferase [Pseudomonadota bacterium]